MNLSAGYYNEHTKQEYINLNDLQNTIDKVIEILEDETNRKSYDYQEIDFTKAYAQQKISKYKDEDDNNEYSLLKLDYDTLTSEEFEEYYGFPKPMNEEDLIKEYYKHYV